MSEALGPFTVEPIAVVRSTRSEAVDDRWDGEITSIELQPPFGPEAVAGIDAFSHLVVVYLFHLVDPERPVALRRHPRGNDAWPSVGIFAQRAKDRPNRLGVSTCRLLGVEGTTLQVEGLDAIDGTPVLDLKPWIDEFGPRGPVFQPSWATELMQGYY